MSAPSLGPRMNQPQPPPTRNTALTGILIGASAALSIAIIAVLGVLAYVSLAGQGANAKAGSEEAPSAATTAPSPSPTGRQYGITLGGGDEEIYPPPPPPAPLQTGTPGTPVDAGPAQVTVLDDSFHPEQPSDAGPSQCINVQITAKRGVSDANARKFWFKSSTQEGVQAYEVIVKGQLVPAVLKQGEMASGLVCFPDELVGDGEKILTFTDEDDNGVEYNVQWHLP
ncbi:hypothetical protein [Dermabacter sp. HMSC08H10]|uniref:hypothetical protein n=1 Tax=Dermabacter sp. HMSC08H10 TaxID=1581144 RepID=UPI00114CAC0B|nr:hypothetical protein [Dermabacter sp. HMSC08H10]